MTAETFQTAALPGATFIAFAGRAFFAAFFTEAAFTAFYAALAAAQRTAIRLLSAGLGMRLTDLYSGAGAIVIGLLSSRRHSRNCPSTAQLPQRESL